MAAARGGGLGRAWRRFRRRPVATQVIALVVVVGIVAGVVVGVTFGSTSSTGSSADAGLGTSGPSGVPVDQASTSSRGVTGSTINVVFPVADLGALAGNFGFAGDAEFGVQPAAIHTYVNEINDSGGINGRKINAMIVHYDPTNETTMRALCKQWTEGSPPVFAVVDGVGTWTGDNQLCVTQEGHTPMIGQWSTVQDWTRLGSPYLWWTGPNQSDILATVVHWAAGAGLVGGNVKVGVLAGDRSSDQLALHQYLLPDLAAVGVHPQVETIPANPADSASTSSAAPLVVQRFKSAGVQSVIPLAPFNVMFPYLAAESNDKYFPKLLLSDYEGSIQSSLGLIPFPDETALEGQQGVTVYTLGGTDAPVPESQGGYNAGVTSCYDTWKAHNAPTDPTVSPYIEEQGPIVLWCQAIRLFGAAAEAAGPNLDRRSFVEAMASTTNHPGTVTPVLSYGPTKFAGPVEYQVVELHNNVPPSPLCVLTYSGQPQGTCWHVVQPWAPLVTSG
jgi:substrate-binding family protein